MMPGRIYMRFTLFCGYISWVCDFICEREFPRYVLNHYPKYLQRLEAEFIEYHGLQNEISFWQWKV